MAHKGKMLMWKNDNVANRHIKRRQDTNSFHIFQGSQGKDTETITSYYNILMQTIEGSIIIISFGENLRKIKIQVS